MATVDLLARRAGRVVSIVFVALALAALLPGAPLDGGRIAAGSARSADASDENEESKPEDRHAADREDERAPREGEPTARGPRIVFVIAEREYETERTLPELFDSELAPRGVRATWIRAPNEGLERDRLRGLPEALRDADLVFLSVRRRAPLAEELDALRKHLRDGKPLVAIRTSSHAFDTRGAVPEGHADWPRFDREVLGGTYTGHYGDGEVAVSVADGAREHPDLRGVSIERTEKLYRSSPLLEGATPLLYGRIPEKDPEPIAWTHRFGVERARIFYTSMGVPDDFKSAAFRELLVRAIYWALERDVPPKVSSEKRDEPTTPAPPRAGETPARADGQAKGGAPREPGE